MSIDAGPSRCEHQQKKRHPAKTVILHPCLLSLSHGISNGFAWISFVLCTHTHICTQAKGWAMCYGLIKKNSCRLLQLYPNTKYIVNYGCTFANSYTVIFTWCINDGHPWSFYSINLTKTSVDPFSRIFALHGDVQWGLGSWTKILELMWHPWKSLHVGTTGVSPRNPKSNFKAHHDNSMQTRSWIVVGPSMFGYSHPSEIYI